MRKLGSTAGRIATEAAAIDSGWTINELLRRLPPAGGVLNAFGIDTCCGGGDTIAAAARKAGVREDDLLAEIGSVVRQRQPEHR